jgi:hypothetical protein
LTDNIWTNVNLKHDKREKFNLFESSKINGINIKI